MATLARWLQGEGISGGYRCPRQRPMVWPWRRCPTLQPTFVAHTLGPRLSPTLPAPSRRPTSSRSGRAHHAPVNTDLVSSPHRPNPGESRGSIWQRAVRYGLILNRGFLGFYSYFFFKKIGISFGTNRVHGTIPNHGFRPYSVSEAKRAGKRNGYGPAHGALSHTGRWSRDCDRGSRGRD